MDSAALSLSLSNCRWRRSAWASATVFEALEEAAGVHDDAANGFNDLWPLMLTLRGRLELPLKVAKDMMAAGGANAHEPFASFDGSQ